MEVILAYMILMLAYLLIIVPIVGKSDDTFNNRSYFACIGRGLGLHIFLLILYGVGWTINWAFNVASNL